MSERW